MQEQQVHSFGGKNSWLGRGTQRMGGKKKQLSAGKHNYYLREKHNFYRREKLNLLLDLLFTGVYRDRLSWTLTISYGGRCRLLKLLPPTEAEWWAWHPFISSGHLIGCILVPIALVEGWDVSSHLLPLAMSMVIFWEKRPHFWSEVLEINPEILRKSSLRMPCTVKCPYFGHIFDFTTFFHCQKNFCAHYLLHTKHVWRSALFRTVSKF